MRISWDTSCGVRAQEGLAVLGEAFTDLPAEWFQNGQVVLCGDDRHVAHIGGQCGQLGLDIDPVPVPSAQGLQGKRVA